MENTIVLVTNGDTWINLEKADKSKIHKFLYYKSNKNPKLKFILCGTTDYVKYHKDLYRYFDKLEIKEVKESKRFGKEFKLIGAGNIGHNFQKITSLQSKGISFETPKENIPEVKKLLGIENIEFESYYEKETFNSEL